MTQHSGAEQTLLSITGLTKTFMNTDPPTEVLRGIDLAVPTGEYLAIMGASGAGKSTLLYTMSGMDQPTGGTVELAGQHLTGLSNQQMSQVRLTDMGFVFQQAYFLKNLNIRDNVLLPALKDCGKGDQAAAEAVVEDLLERFGIASIANHGITQVSGGQLQRASLCRALATGPKIVFADEPTGALNSSATQDTLDAFTETHQVGTTIVMVTHDPVCAARADRVVYLVDGRLVGTLTQGTWQRQDSAHREDELLSWLSAQGF